MQIPVIGLGTWQITDKFQMLDIIEKSCQAGYRFFDTAAAYSNEIILGKALGNISVQRRELFIQDKLWNTYYGYEEVQIACKKSLHKLKLDYLDAFLIHWPASPKQFHNWQEINADTWRGMEQLYRDGYVRAIGVCNFEIQHLTELIKTATVVPFIDQIEFHPGAFSAELLSYCESNGICVEAASPLGNGRILNNDFLCGIARQKKITTAQLCLAWGLQHGCIVIPKTVHLRCLLENMQSEHINLDEEVMEKIDRLPFMGRLVMDDEKGIHFERA